MASITVNVKNTRWQCTKCGATQTTQGLRPSVGSFCGKSTDHRHKWTKV